MTEPAPETPTSAAADATAPSRRPPDTAPPPEPDHVENPKPFYRRQPVFLVCIVLAVGVIAVPASLLWWDDESNPVEVVEKYFDAIADRDVERALSLVGRGGYGVPVGEKAAFLHPDAIADDWELRDVSLRENDTDLGLVDITIGDSEHTERGTIEVSDYDGQWKLDDPFVYVEFSATSLTYLRVNDRTVSPAELYAHDLTGLTNVEYPLFPGMQRFFGQIKGSSADAAPGELRVPDVYGSNEPPPVSPPAVTLTDDTRTRLQRAVDDLVDECATYRVRQPALCPFGIDAYYRRGDTYYQDIHDVEWTVAEHPTVEVADPGATNDRSLGIPVEFTDPGRITLSATVTVDSGDRETELTVECEMSAESLRVALRPDGKPELYPLSFQGGGLLQIPADTQTCGDEED